MKLAIIDKKDMTLKIEQSCLKFEEQSIPFRLIDMLILNHRTTFVAKDILRLTKENISILLISHNSSNFSIINSANAKNSEIKLAQYRSLEQRLAFAKYFLTHKLTLHQEHLKSFGIQGEISKELQQVEDASAVEELLGIEGSYARAYFAHYFAHLPKTMHKGCRSRKPPRDPVNALLSYWYSLYYHIITAKLLSHGFEPSLGYLHTPFRSHNALSSDILELFRSSINQAVASVFHHNILQVEDFSKKGGVYLRFEGRKRVWGEFSALVELLKPKLDKEIANLKKAIHETDTSH